MRFVISPAPYQPYSRTAHIVDIPNSQFTRNGRARPSHDCNRRFLMTCLTTSIHIIPWKRRPAYGNCAHSQHPILVYPSTFATRGIDIGIADSHVLSMLGRSSPVLSALAVLPSYIMAPSLHAMSLDCEKGCLLVGYVMSSDTVLLSLWTTT